MKRSAPLFAIDASEAKILFLSAAKIISRKDEFGVQPQ